MSGIELAGLVVGAFPLLIAALEHYRDAANVLEVFWKIKREYKHWVHDLRICELAFERNLEALLLLLIVDDDEIPELLKDPRGPRWQDPELEARLKERLSKSYPLYLESISRIQGVMQEVKKQLGVVKLDFQTKVSEDTDNRSNASLKATFDFQSQRIKMSLNKSKRDSLFRQLTKAIDELRDLLDSSDRIATLRQSRRVANTAETKGMWRFWRHTDKLYRLLARSWLCECRHSHLANLLLQHRTSPTPDFRVFFFFGNCSRVTEPPWARQEARIRMLEPDGDGPKPKERSVVSFAPDPVPSPSPTPAATPGTAVRMAPTPPPPPALRSPSQTLSSSSREESREEQKKPLKLSFLGKFKRDSSSEVPVSISLPASAQSSIQSAVSAPTMNSATAAAAATVTVTSTEIPEPPQLLVTNADDNGNQERVESGEEMIEIINLCDEIPKFPAKAVDGQLFCLKDGHCRVALNPVCHSRLPATTSAAARDTISLEALLRKDTRRTLTRRERYLIALTLASSYLQLKSSPWIRAEWSKRDILFLWDGENPDRIRLHQPYISRYFEGAADDAEDGDEDIVVPMGRFDRNDRTLAGLGIMLLELCFGTALEEHETRRNYYHYHATSPGEEAGGGPAANPFLDMAAALEWFPRAAEEAGPEFADAIGWCLTCMPGSGESDGTLDKWREELFSKVVLPLKYCHDQFVAAKS